MLGYFQVIGGVKIQNVPNMGFGPGSPAEKEWVKQAVRLNEMRSSTGTARIIFDDTNNPDGIINTAYLVELLRKVKDNESFGIDAYYTPNPAVYVPPADATLPPATVESSISAAVAAVNKLTAQGVPQEQAIQVVSTEAAKQVVVAIEPTKIDAIIPGAALIVTNLVDSGVPKEDAIDKVSTETANQITAKPVPTWMIIAGIGVVVIGGTVVYLIARKKRS